jgi:uncharacterized protein YukE
MSFEGMDVDQLQGLAKQIDSDAQVLYNLVTDLTGAVAGLTLLWHGPMAATFEQDWQSKNRPALLAAYNTLRDLHAHLVSNISQQTSASAAEGGLTVKGVVGGLEDGLKVASAVGLPFAIISELGGGPKPPGAGLLGKAWSFSTEDYLFRLSPDDVGWVRTTARLFTDSPLDKGLKVLGVAGSAISAFHAVDDLYRSADDVANGHYADAATELVEGVADGLQAYPSPVTYLAGVGLKLADQVAVQELTNAPSPVSGSNFQQGYVPALTSAGTGPVWEQAGKTLWGAM